MSNGTYRSEDIWLELLTESRKKSNFCWAFILFFGSLGFLLVGTSSYLGRNLISFLPSEQISFSSQGMVMFFYGIAGLFISFYLWCTIFWNVGSGYNLFDRKNGRVYIFRWGFPGKNRRIFFRFFLKDIRAIQVEVKDGFFARRVLYLDIRGYGTLPFIRSDEDLTLGTIDRKAVDLAYFLCLAIEAY
uniref:Photosystem I assembly protein Ycf4 n=1 Tax=Rhabdadenia biflora TaxID=179644 RepID=A0A0A0S0A6_9GENT|nr:photosystem I assembly protein ycf4 [Rhabdadenia biflora]